MMGTVTTRSTGPGLNSAGLPWRWHLRAVIGTVEGKPLIWRPELVLLVWLGFIPVWSSLQISLSKQAGCHGDMQEASEEGKSKCLKWRQETRSASSRGRGWERPRPLSRSGTRIRIRIRTFLMLGPMLHYQGSAEPVRSIIQLHQRRNIHTFTICFLQLPDLSDWPSWNQDV